VTVSHAVYDANADDRVLGVSAMDVPHKQLSGVVDQLQATDVVFCAFSFGSLISTPDRMQCTVPRKGES
jgi:hypothetical protein